MKAGLRKTQFTIETFPGKIFEGYTLGENWNGWACPFFDFQEASRIVDIYNETSGKAQYEKSSNEFIFAHGEEIFSQVEMEGLKLYPVGAFHWIWEEENDSAMKSHLQII